MEAAGKTEVVEKALRTGNLNSFFADVLDARRDQIEAAVHAVLNPQEKVSVVVECPRCKAAANGRNMKSIKITGNRTGLLATTANTLIHVLVDEAGRLKKEKLTADDATVDQQLVQAKQKLEQAELA